MAVSTTIALNDRMSGPLSKIMKSIDQTIRVMERMDSAANNIDTRGLSRARRSIEGATSDLARLNSASRTGLGALGGGLNNVVGPAERARGAVRNFFSSFAGAAAAYVSIQGLTRAFQSFVKASDEYVSTTARLSNINDGLQTQVQLQDKIYAAAQRSGGAYNAMAGSVAKLNLLAGDAFSSNDEAIRFTELMEKSFSVSGAGQSEKSAGMHQLTQAMASGRLQGDEFRSITENAPLLAHAIADSVGVSMGELKKLSSEGKITSDIIKNALFTAADDIEMKFKAMPMTFGMAMTKMKNWALVAFEPLLIRFNDFVNSDAFATMAGHAMFFVNIFVAAMSIMFTALEWVYMAVATVGQFFQDNWAWIAPIVIVVAAALGTLAMILSINAAWWLIVAAAKMTAAAAMWAVNTAVAAFPGTWILIAFVAVVALVIYAFIQWGEVTANVIGIIVGSFYWLGSATYNVVMYIVNLFIAGAEWIYNNWTNMIHGIQMLFYVLQTVAAKVLNAVAGGVEGVVNSVLTGISKLINQAITKLNQFIALANAVPGVNIDTVGKVDWSIGDGLSSFTKKATSNMDMAAPKPPAQKKFARMEYDNMGASFDRGYKDGSALSQKATGVLTKVADKISGFVGGGANGKGNPFSPDTSAMDAVQNALNGAPSMPAGAGKGGSAGKLPKGAGNPTGGKLDSIGKINDDISIADEDLKMLLEAADIKSIQNFKTLNPTVNFTGGMTIREDADIDKIIQKIDESLNNGMNESTEGAYT